MEGPQEPAAPRPRAKRVLLVLAGAFDPPGARTPLEEAEKPSLDRMARGGRAGTAALDAGSPWEGFTALLGLSGAPSLGAAEALGTGLELAPGEIVYRADFVTIADGVLVDPLGGKVRDPEAALLLDAMQAASPDVRFHRAGGHRNLAVLRGPVQFCPSPWEMAGRRPALGLPQEGPVRTLHERSTAVLGGEDVNSVRIDLGENPANALWFHGGGPPAQGSSGARPPTGGAVLVGRGAATAGLARALGWQASVVEGDDEVLAAAALAAVAAADLVVVRTESILDAAALRGAAAKSEELSRVDARLVAPLLAAVEERDAYVMAVAADSVVDSSSRALVRRPVPIVVQGTGRGVGDAAFTERNADASGYRLSAAEFAALVVSMTT